MHPLAIVALGANLGAPRQTILRAFDRLQKMSTAPLLRSSLWESTPVDCPPGSPRFVNAAAGLTPPPDESPETLLARLKELEMEFGRKPKAVLNEPRALDLDLVAFGSEVRSSAEIILPHPRAHQREFVLRPVAEIAPDLILPGQTRTITELLDQLPASSEVVKLF